MQPATPIPFSMNAVTSLYQTRVTFFTFDGTIAQSVLLADARRYFVQFFVANGAGAQTVMPFPAAPDPAIVGVSNLPIEWKWRDCPALVSGAFVGCGMLGTTMWIVEELYVGG